MEHGENVVDFIRMPVNHIEQGVTVASQDQPVLGTAGQDFVPPDKGGSKLATMVVGSPLSASPPRLY